MTRANTQRVDYCGVKENNNYLVMPYLRPKPKRMGSHIEQRWEMAGGVVISDAAMNAYRPVQPNERADEEERATGRG